MDSFFNSDSPFSDMQHLNQIPVLATHQPRVLIFGSCVSRDILNVRGRKDFELVDYFARSSLAVFSSVAPTSAFRLDGIESAFQRRMVERDINKDFLSFLEQTNFDILLIDLIDERFSLCEISEGSFVTVSNEFLKAGIPCVVNGHVRRVASGSAEFKELWAKGVKALFTTLQSLGLINKVYINCVQWADRLEDGTTAPCFSAKLVQPANALLQWMYQHLTQYLPEHQFLNFDPSLFVGSKEHVWGVSPFHYIGRYYEVAGGMVSALVDQPTANQTPAQTWHLFNSNRPELISTGGAIEDMTDSEMDKVLTGKVDEVYSGEDAWKTRFSQDEIGCIEALLSRMGTTEFRDELVLQVSEKGFLELPSLFGGRTARCTQSVYVQSRNFLRFQDKDATFYLVQHHKFARAIYFPLRSIVIVIDVIALPKSAIYALNRELAKNLALHIQNSRRYGEARFAGILASYPRPYHFFYDTLPVVFHVHRNLVPVSRWPAVIQFEGGAFVSIAKFLGAPDKQLMLSGGDALNARLSAKNEFCIQLGYATRRDPNFEELDTELIKFGTRETEKDRCFSEQFSRAKACYPLIWFGICSEKRSWKEQIEGVTGIVNRLAIRYPNLGVVFDGITSTCVQNREAIREALAVNEIDAVRRISELLDRPVAMFDLIGSQSAIKIAFAARVTSFLTNFLTDSMYVARIARKPGLAHGAKGAMHSDHQHPNTYFVPKEWVKDEVSAQANWSAVSYSIPSELVGQLFDLVASERRWSLADFSVFSPNSQISIRKLPKGQEIISSSDDRPEYLSVNGHVLRFDHPAEDSTQIHPGEALDFYFRGRAEGELTANLTVIAHNGSGRSLTATVPLGDSRHVRFPPDATSYRLFIRLKGKGRVVINSIEVVPNNIDQTARDDKALAVAAPSSIGDGLLRWNQAIFDYTSPQAFLANDKDHPTGIHRLAFGEKWLEFNFYRNSEPDLVIFFNGNLSRTKNTTLPAFSGMGAVGALKASILMVNDPCLYYSGDLSLAWYAGAEDFPLQQLLPDLLKSLAAKYGARRTILYGGSGGGFAALHYAPAIENSIAVVCNPQTDLTRYNRESVERYVDTCLGGNPNSLPLDQLFSSKGVAYKTSPAFSLGNHRVIYLQNKLDHHHWKNHLSPYLDQLGFGEPRDDAALVQSLSDRATLIVSDKWGNGHSAAPRKFVFGLLELLLGERQGHDLFVSIEHLHESSISVLEQCTLKVNDKSFVASVSLALGSDIGPADFAWYLYKDGSRIETKPYAKHMAIKFETLPEPGIYWAVAFLRSKEVKQSMRSNKNYGK